MSQNYTITIPAASGTVPGLVNLMVQGRFVHVVSATASFKAAVNDGSQFTINRFEGFGSSESAFSKLSFFNSAATAITATIYVGDVPYSGAQTTATVISTEDSFEHVQIHEGNLSATTAVLIDMILNNRFVHSITVTNFDATLWLYLRDSTSTDNFYAIGPGQTIEQVIGGGANELELYNPNGSTVNCLAAAKYYF